MLAFKFGIAVDEVAVCRSGPLTGYVRHPHPSLMSAVQASKCECTSELEWAILVRDTEHRAMVLPRALSPKRSSLARPCAHTAANPTCESAYSCVTR